MVKEKSCIVEVERFSKKGHGIGSCTEFSKQVEIPKVFIGEKVLAKIFKSKQGLHQADLISIETKHPARVSARCEQSDVCGGCSWQQLAYPIQLEIKEKKIKELFKELALDAKIKPIIAMDDPWQFRNKMEFTFFQTRENEKSIGLVKTGSKGRVIDIKRCHLCPTWMSQALEATRQWWNQTNIEAYHRLKQTGTLHLLTLREGTNTKEKMVILTVCGEPSSSFTHQELKGFKEALCKAIPDLTSLFLQIKTIKEGSPTTASEMLIYGKDHIEEKMSVKITEELEKTYVFKISPSSFFQPSTPQAEKLLAAALELMKERPLRTVLDLYCGTATFGMVFSSLANQVIGVELNPYAVYDAQVNIERNQISNLKVIRADVKDVLKVIQDLDQIDLVIIDPPRAGLGHKAIEDVVKFNSETILYVSCNPYTQAEDVKILIQKGYRVESIGPLDQFAHTPHVENIVLLTKMPLSSTPS